MTQLFRLFFPEGVGLRRNACPFYVLSRHRKGRKKIYSYDQLDRIRWLRDVGISRHNLLHPLQDSIFGEARTERANPLNYARRGFSQARKEARMTCS